MSKLTDIKYRMDQLDGGAFQNLCDVYLSRSGYKNVYSLGMKSGTDKTAKGNPDTYFLNADDEYIFVMYTTQKTDFFNKAIEDIQKCFDASKTGVEPKNVAEIIYCHTYGRLSPGEDKALRDFCQKKGALLTLKGLDEIATDLYLYHHAIARDKLGVAVDSGQIFDIASFIDAHDTNKMAAPLNTEFLFRDSDKESSRQKLESHDVLIISGPAGIGKTRFAIEICNNYVAEHGCKLFCIKSNNLEIYEDLKDVFEPSGNYALMIDDANELTGLHHALHYLTKQNGHFTIKIIITVREYARQDVIKDVSIVEKPATMKLTQLTDEEIRQLIENCYGITNPLYTDRIISIAEGNARLAMLAGKLATTTGNISAIRDASQLYDSYYGKQIEDILSESRTAIISAGIIAFLHAIHLEHLDRINIIFSVSGITKEDFTVDIKKLHDFELVDICNDKATKIADQSFGNFLLKYIFIDRKLIPLHTMIKTCFSFNQPRTIAACNVLFNVFSDKPTQEFIEQEVNVVWDELKSDEENFGPFLKAFHMIRPTETLLLMHSHIEAEPQQTFDVVGIDFKKADNGASVDNEIIEILSTFSEHQQLAEAIDLLLIYYQKRPDLFMQFYWVFTNCYGINKDSDRYAYYTQKTVIDHLADVLETAPSDENILLFIRVAAYFLELFYTPVEGGRHNTFTMYQIPLQYTKPVVSYRTRIWQQLQLIYAKGKFTSAIEELLSDYGASYNDKADVRIIRDDFIEIISFFVRCLSPENLLCCIIAEHMQKIGDRAGITNLTFLTPFLSSVKYNIYRVLTENFYKLEIDYHESEALRRKHIEQHAARFTESDVETLLQVCAEYEVTCPNNCYKLSEGLLYVFEELSKEPSFFVWTAELYLKNNTPCDIYPEVIIRKLFEFLPCDKVEKIISHYQYERKNAWQWAFYAAIPQEQITQKHVEELYAFLESPPITLHNSRLRPLDVICKYEIIDHGVFLKASRIISRHYDESPFVFSLYFSLLFNPHHQSASEVIAIFETDLPLLLDIYLKSIEFDQHEDHDGAFLMQMIMDIGTDILNDYLEHMLVRRKSMYWNIDAYCNRLLQIWIIPHCLEIFDFILLCLQKQLEDEKWRLRYVLEKLFIHEHSDDIVGNQDKWIKHIIDNNSMDKMFVYSLFDAISEFTEDRRRNLLIYFVTLNPDPELFDSLPLEASHWGGMGSMIPYMEARISYLSSLLPYFSGLKYLKHKKRIERDILQWQERIHREEIDELLRS